MTNTSGLKQRKPTLVIWINHGNMSPLKKKKKEKKHNLGNTYRWRREKYNWENSTRWLYCKMFNHKFTRVKVFTIHREPIYTISLIWDGMESSIQTKSKKTLHFLKPIQTEYHIVIIYCLLLLFWFHFFKCSDAKKQSFKYTFFLKWRTICIRLGMNRVDAAVMFYVYV